MSFACSILALDREIFRGSVRSLSVPGVLGRTQILARHIPMVAALEEGDVVIEREDGARDAIPVAGGVVEVRNDRVVVLISV